MWSIEKTMILMIFLHFSVFVWTVVSDKWKSGSVQLFICLQLFTIKVNGQLIYSKWLSSNIKHSDNWKHTVHLSEGFLIVNSLSKLFPWEFKILDFHNERLL